MVRSIKLVLFDRSFYSKELITALTDASYPHLIFVPKNEKVAAELKQMAEGERKTVRYEFELNKDHTVLWGETTLAFLKKVIDPRNGRSFDWSFATNQEEINLDYIVPTYKGRWRIETGFRVQDEARKVEVERNQSQILFLHLRAAPAAALGRAVQGGGEFQEVPSRAERDVRLAA